MLNVERFIFGPFETNCYVVSDEQGNVLLIDPACSNEYEQQQLKNYLNRQLAIIATHGHLDHLWGAKWATEQWNTPVLMHEADIPLAQAMQQQYDMFGIRRTAERFETAALTEYRPFASLTDRIQSELQIIHTPGHTPGSISLYFPEEKVLFSGDTLFQMGYGRTDLPGGNYGQLLDSLEHLFSLPSDVRVYPGHGEPTTIGQESRY